MAHSFIGKPISLISHSDVRYRGILAGIDPHASTIQLSNVYSMGTESRRPAGQYIPPMAEPYQYIIFKASEVKDLSVDEPVAAAQRNVHDDPAVMASAPIANAPGPGGYAQQGGAVPPGQQYPPRPPQQSQQAPPSAQQPAASTQQNATVPVPPQDGSAAPSQAAAPSGAITPRTQQLAQNRRPNPVHSAAASLESVERALGDLRVSNGPGANHTGRGGRRGGRGPREGDQPLTVPKTDFDFASSNAKFDKSALAPVTPDSAEQAQGDEPQDTEGAEAEDKKDKGPAAYNPKSSFFDTLSSNTVPDANNNRSVGGRGRGRGGRSRRDEEREKNVATFGEPGGVGLMGPGAYVGGWGGYGRRGGRGRRGGPGGGRGGSNQGQVVQARG
ncbi:hypothetical protein FA13DRAFT_1760554 [Coprinellus micaceus]|uniref:TFG box profile domain-containing protein n=1 Tax=Coprinellus micaceus TaxID=71717 RepID=A0A4Y7S9S6_COPMI|nr:hypothetical protein FA13DRAFT_1699650 [Coprinellus micaceus]TEB39533.1 hypothetical protein FA13DRAFT_1760554 [Coprinellus micaceus]